MKDNRKPSKKTKKTKKELAREWLYQIEKKAGELRRALQTPATVEGEALCTLALLEEANMVRIVSDSDGGGYTCYRTPSEPKKASSQEADKGLSESRLALGDEGDQAIIDALAESPLHDFGFLGAQKGLFARVDDKPSIVIAPDAKEMVAEARALLTRLRSTAEGIEEMAAERRHDLRKAPRIEMD